MDEDGKSLLLLSAPILLAGALFFGDYLWGRNHRLFDGEIGGKTVQYFEYSKENIVRVKGKEKTYELKDKNEFTRLGDFNFAPGQLEEVVIDVSTDKSKTYKIEDADKNTLEAGAARTILKEGTDEYNKIREEIHQRLHPTAEREKPEPVVKD